MILLGTLLLLFTFVAAVLLPSQSAAAPANDDFAAAQPVGPIPVDVPANNIGATAEEEEHQHGGANDAVNSVWFRWTSTLNGTAVVDICEQDATLSDSTVLLSVYTGEQPDELTEVRDGNECLLRFPATVGTVYKIAVDFIDEEGNFRFKLREIEPPAYDSFNESLQIGPGLPIEVEATTVDSTWESADPHSLTFGDTSRARTIWFLWTPIATGRVRIDVCDFEVVSGAGNRRVAVYAETSPELPLVDSTTICTLGIDVTQGITYRIAFNGYISGEGDLTLKVFDATPPPNDDFAEAKPLGPALPVSEPGDNDFATVEVDEPEHVEETGPSRSLWYQWTAPSSMVVRINSCTEGLGTQLGVYTGNALTSLARVGERLASCHVSIDAVKDTTYKIAVGGGFILNPRGGPFTLRIEAYDPPPNDDFANALNLGSQLPLTLLGRNTHAGAEAGEPTHRGFNNPVASVWFRWTAPATGPMVIDACDADFPTAVGLYTGAAVDDLTPVLKSDMDMGEREQCDPGPSHNGRVSFPAIAGQSYWIAVDSYNDGIEGQFLLSIFDPTAVPPPPPGLAPLADRSNSAGKCRRIGKRVKRARCIRKAQLRAATKRCRRIGNRGRRQACVRQARRRTSAAFCRNAFPQGKKRARCLKPLRRR